jgi:pimeloyl-ACP methyl ester carboxylesterase
MSELIPHDEAPVAGTASRRGILTLAGTLGLTSLVGCSRSSSEPAGATSSSTPSTLALGAQESTLGAAPASPFQLLADPALNFQALFALGGAGVVSEVGEVITAVQQASSADGGVTNQSYFDAMVAMGNATAARADDALAAGHRVTASERYLRAAQYYDQALFFVLGTTEPERERSVYETMAGMWAAAGALSEPAWERVEIPYEDTTLPAWFLSPPGASGRRPTVILNNGSDGQSVDLYAWGAKAANDRGWNAVILEGPGQGEMLFVREVPFRPDWEAVITPVVDHLAERNDVDDEKIALVGWSQGGELVARAAAFEHRLAAVVTDPGSVDIYLAFPEPLREIAKGEESEVNTIWEQDIIPETTPEQQFTLRKRLEIFSAEALRQARSGEVPSDWYGLSRRIEEFQVRDVADKITSPVLVIDYEDEEFYPGQAQELMDLLKAPADMVLLTAEEGAQFHCAPMAPQYRNEVVFDWLDEQVAKGS